MADSLVNSMDRKVDNVEPMSYGVALLGPNVEEWRQALNKKIKSMCEKFRAWSIICLGTKQLEKSGFSHHM